MRQFSSVADDFPQQLDKLLAWDMSKSSDVDVVVAENSMILLIPILVII